MASGSGVWIPRSFASGCLRYNTHQDISMWSAEATLHKPWSDISPLWTLFLFSLFSQITHRNEPFALKPSSWGAWWKIVGTRIGSRKQIQSIIQEPHHLLTGRQNGPINGSKWRVECSPFGSTITKVFTHGEEDEKYRTVCTGLSTASGVSLLLCLVSDKSKTWYKIQKAILTPSKKILISCNQRRECWRQDT